MHYKDPPQHRGPVIAKRKAPEVGDDGHDAQMLRHCRPMPLEAGTQRHGNQGKVYKRKLGVASTAGPLRHGSFESLASDPKCPKIAAKIAAFRAARNAAE